MKIFDLQLKYSYTDLSNPKFPVNLSTAQICVLWKMQRLLNDIYDCVCVCG